MAAPERFWITAPIARPTAATVLASAARPNPNVWIVISGPYRTRAEATAALTKRDKPPDLPISIPNPLSGLSDVGKAAHWLGDIVSHLTDLAMWRSLGWMLLGAVLIFAGIYLWFRTSATYDDLQNAVLGGVKAAV